MGRGEKKLAGARERRRKSKDSKIKKEGRMLVGFIEETGWIMLRGEGKGRQRRGIYVYGRQERYGDLFGVGG